MHNPLNQRLNELKEFRNQHEIFLRILIDILSEKDDIMILELQDLYKNFLSTPGLDILDTTSNGQLIWSNARSNYEKKIEEMEQSISRLICDQLKNAKSIDETFRLFAIFNPLFIRRSIWNDVSSYRVGLVRDVHNDIERLQEKFKQRYDESLEKITTDLRDISLIYGLKYKENGYIYKVYSIILILKYNYHHNIQNLKVLIMNFQN